MSCSTDGLRGGFDAACLPPGGGENKRQVAVGRTEGGMSVRFSDGPLGQEGQSHNATDVPPLPYDRRNIGEHGADVVDDAQVARTHRFEIA